MVALNQGGGKGKRRVWREISEADLTGLDVDLGRDQSRK